MKKITETFVCDCCGEPLPKKYVEKNGIETTYFNNRKFNTFRFPGGTEVSVEMCIDISEYGPTYKELCNKCRVSYIRRVLDLMDAKGGAE